MTPLGSILSRAQVLRPEISAWRLCGARGAMLDALRAQVRAPGLARALLACSRRPPHPVHPCSFSRSLVARAPCAGRVRVVRDVWKAPGASAAAGGALRAATGLWGAHEWPIRPNLTKSTAQTFLFWCEIGREWLFRLLISCLLSLPWHCQAAHVAGIAVLPNHLQPGITARRAEEARRELRLLRSS